VSAIGATFAVTRRRAVSLTAEGIVARSVYRVWLWLHEELLADRDPAHPGVPAPGAPTGR
jgi:hypothetical protein